MTKQQNTSASQLCFFTWERANYAESRQYKSRLAPSFNFEPRPIEGAESVTLFVTGDVVGAEGERYSTIRAIVTHKGGAQSFHLISGIGEFTYRKRLVYALGIFTDSEMRYIYKDGVLSHQYKATVVQPMAPTTGQPVASKPITDVIANPKHDYTIPHGQPGYVPQMQRPPKKRDDIKTWKASDLMDFWMENKAAPPGCINSDRVMQEIPLIREMWAFNVKTPERLAKYEKWKVENPEAQVTQSAKDDAVTGSVNQTDLLNQAMKGLTSGLFDDPGLAFQWFQENGGTLPQLDFEAKAARL